MNSSLVFVDVDRITSRVEVRGLKTQGVERLKSKIGRLGFQPDKPVRVYETEDGYCLIDGNHRVEAAIALSISQVPALIVDSPANDLDAIQQARESNEASEAVVPTTFVDDAELVWKLCEKHTQAEAAKAMGGWSRAQISQYVMLSRLCSKAWEIVATTFCEPVATDGEEPVAALATTVASPFTEGTLRSILQLAPEQQLELVQDLADGQIQKGQFKSRAENYRSRNDLWNHCQEKLGQIDADILERCKSEVYKGVLDKPWKDGGAENPKIKRFVQSFIDEWQEKHSVQLIRGDFFEEVKGIPDESVDLVVTDPPYNIANGRIFDFKNDDGSKKRSDISQDFGDWDKLDKNEFIQMFRVWALDFKRILKPHGSGYIFTSDKYFSYLRDAFEAAGLKIKTPLVWVKLNPGTQVIKTNYKSAFELILFFTKSESGHTFTWQGENEMRNWVESPICQGNERLKDPKGQTLHPTQKPEKVIRHLLEVSSNRGDVVFDGFMGVGTVPAVAKKLGRKCIGIEQNSTFFDSAKRRLEAV